VLTTNRQQEMTQNTTIEKKFQTPIGLVRCGLKADFINDNSIQTKSYEHGTSELFKTKSHQIELVEFKIRLPLYNGDTVTDTLGWIWRIEKLTHKQEQLETYCLLDKLSEQIQFDTARREHLDAIEAYNDDWTLHIGTEDGEVMNSRAADNDWFPSRLRHTVDFYQSITAMKEHGFITTIPDLHKDEKLHLQYLERELLLFSGE